MGIALTDDGLLPAGTDVAEVLARGDVRELTAVWNTYGRRSFYQRALDERSGLTEKARQGLQELTEELAELAEVSPVQALEANRRLAELLTGRRWYVMQDAREHGATWTEIGAAVDLTKQGAQDWYRRKIEQQEKYAPDVHGRDSARAVLKDDPTAPPTPGAT